MERQGGQETNFIQAFRRQYRIIIILKHLNMHDNNYLKIGPRREKTGLRGFRPGLRLKPVCAATEEG